MIEIDRFYNAALANPTTTAEDFRDQAEAAKNPQRVRRADTVDERERDASRAPREALNASVSGTRQKSLPPTEVQAIQAKLGVGNAARESVGRPLETRSVREAERGFDEGNFDDAVDREVNALLDAILSQNAVTTPGQETPGDFTSIKTLEGFRTAVGNTIRDIGTSIKQAYRETPSEGRTPDVRHRSLEALRKAGDVCQMQMRKATSQEVDFDELFTELLGLVASVAAGCAILSVVVSMLKIAQVFLEAKWTAETAETEVMTREAKERLEEMLEKLKQVVEDLKLKLKLQQARTEDKRTLHEGLRVGGFRGSEAVAGLQQSSVLLIMRRLEDVEKLVAGYERRTKERQVAGDAVKVM